MTGSDQQHDRIGHWVLWGGVCLVLAVYVALTVGDGLIEKVLLIPSVSVVSFIYSWAIVGTLEYLIRGAVRTDKNE